MIDKSSLFKMSGLPESFGAIVLIFSFILLLAPYFSGADFGVFKIPTFTVAAKKWFKMIGPTLFIACVLSFIPMFPVKNSEKAEVNVGTKAPTTPIINTNQIATELSPTPKLFEIQQRDPDLTVDFEVKQYTGAEALIGNQGQGIILIRDLTINWDYSKCPKFEHPLAGAPLVTYRYNVDLTTSEGSKILDSKEFKYGPGDVDEFLVDLNYPDYGVYTIWLSFKYKRLGNKTEQFYETKRIERWVCEKF